MQEPLHHEPLPIDDLDFGIIAIATIRSSLTFTLECLGRSAVHAPDLKTALEDVLSLASRRELEARVLRNVQCAQLGTGSNQTPASMRAAPYEALGALQGSGEPVAQRPCFQQRM